MPGPGGRGRVDGRAGTGLHHDERCAHVHGPSSRRSRARGACRGACQRTSPRSPCAPGSGRRHQRRARRNAHMDEARRLALVERKAPSPARRKAGRGSNGRAAKNAEQLLSHAAEAPHASVVQSVVPSDLLPQDTCCTFLRGRLIEQLPQLPVCTLHPLADGGLCTLKPRCLLCTAQVAAVHKVKRLLQSLAQLTHCTVCFQRVVRTALPRGRPHAGCRG